MILCAHQCSNPFVSFLLKNMKRLPWIFLFLHLAQSETGFNVVVIFLLKRCETDESLSLSICVDVDAQIFLLIVQFCANISMLNSWMFYGSLWNMNAPEWLAESLVAFTHVRHSSARTLCSFMVCLYTAHWKWFIDFFLFFFGIIPRCQLYFILRPYKQQH